MKLSVFVAGCARRVRLQQVLQVFSATFDRAAQLGRTGWARVAHGRSEQAPELRSGSPGKGFDGLKQGNFCGDEEKQIWRPNGPP